MLQAGAMSGSDGLARSYRGKPPQRLERLESTLGFEPWTLDVAKARPRKIGTVLPESPAPIATLTKQP
jgi:hypothetical protein